MLRPASPVSPSQNHGQEYQKQPGGQEYRQTTWYYFCTVRGLGNGVCRQVDGCNRPSGHRLPRGRLADPADAARLVAIVSRRRLPDAQAYCWKSPRSQTRLHHVPGQKAQNFLGTGCQSSMRMNECDYRHEIFCDSRLDVLTEIDHAKGIRSKHSPSLEKSHRVQIPI